MSRPRWLVLLVLSVLFAAWWAAGGPLAPTSAQQRKPLGIPSSELIVVNSVPPGGGQQIVVVDPASRVMGTYAVDGRSGEISLKSVRNFSWDLYLEEFNAAQPAPREIKALLEQQ